MRSSYKDNSYDKMFEALMYIHKPAITVELGVLDGFSLFAMAKVAKLYGGQVSGVDLFDDYDFKHANPKELSKYILENKLENHIILIKEEASKAANLFENDSVELLHVDISNTGSRLKDIFKAWYPKLKKHGILVFEGGSPERDKIDWMKGEVPIAFFKHILQESGQFEVLTLLPFPSITLCRKLK